MKRYRFLWPPLLILTGVIIMRIFGNNSAEMRPALLIVGLVAAASLIGAVYKIVKTRPEEQE